MSVLHGNGTGKSLGYKWVFRVYIEEDGQERIAATYSTPEEAGYMIEELKELDEYRECRLRFAREKEITIGGSNENND